MKFYNQIYGNKSVGAGSWMSKKLFKENLINPFSKNVIKSFKKQIYKDFKRIKVLKKLKNFDVMDVGSGRQALAILEMGAKSVDHYDISLNNINKFRKILKNKKLIRTIHADICKKNFNKKIYDLIYLQGIIHHVKYPYMALNNISKATNKFGIVWLYHYQCTSPVYFYISTLRNIFNKKKLSSLFYQLNKLNFSKKKLDFLMDDLGCDFIHLYNPKYYKINMENLGFKQFYQKEVINIDNGINYNLNKPSCLTAYKKEKIYKKKKINNFRKKINVFDYKNYIMSQQKSIKELNLLNRKIIKYLKKNRRKINEIIKIVKPLLESYFNFANQDKLQFKKMLDSYRRTCEFIK
tara:strand:+ start:1215 stop:2267 length:1053 start_codon:yes stop_codon:yes gene_type:complete